MRKIVMLIVTIALATTLHAAVAGWQNNGRGDFPDTNPPYTFNGEKGINVRWKAKLPNWTNGSPTLVVPADGNAPARVVCMSEPLDYSPILTCIDADTGKELWRRELDAVAAMPKDQQNDVRALAQKCWARMRARKALIAEGRTVYANNKAALDIQTLKNRGHGNGAEEKKNFPTCLEPLFKRASEIGCDFQGISGSSISFEFKAEGAQEVKRLEQLGLSWSVWDGTWDGVGFSTPVSDGRYIWAFTAHNLYSCFDLDGKLVWQVRFPPANAKMLTEKDKLRIKGRWPIAGGSDTFVTSPLVVDGNMITNAAMMLRCLDALTGQLKWELPMPGYQTQCVGVPGVFRLDGENYIVTVGDTGRGKEGDEIVRLRDGAVVGILPGQSCGKASLYNPIVIADDIVLNNGFTGWRMVLKDGKIVPEKIWEAQLVGPWDRVCWRDGLVYTQGGVFDGRVGKLLAKAEWGGGGYAEGGGILVGNMHVGWSFNANGSGIYYFNDLTTRQRLGEGRLPVNPADGASLQQKIEQEGGGGWHWISAGHPLAYKDRLYVRSYDFLWCIGPAVKGTSQDDPKAAETIRALTKVEDLLPYLDKPSAMERYEAVLALGKLGVGAAPAIAKLTTLVKEDIYDEIRAAAVTALDAADPAGKPGITALQTAIAGNLGTDACLAQTLVQLGAERATAVVVPLLDKGRPEGDRINAARILSFGGIINMGILNTPITTALANSLARGSWQVSRTIGHAIAYWPGDPASAILLRDALAKNRGDVPDEHDAHPAVLIYIATNLPEADRVPYLKTMITGGSRNKGKALEILRQLANGTNKTLADAAAVELKTLEATKP